jgi:hypothetical protein
MSTTHTLRQPSPSSKLPMELVAQALRDLPHTAYLFIEALKSAENLDESDFGRWDVQPPFEPEPLIMDTISEAKYTENLAIAMHGRRLRQQQEQDQTRVIRSRGKLDVEIVDGLCNEITEALQVWQEVNMFLSSYVAGSRELTMADHYIMWQARKVVHLQGMLDSVTSHNY